MPALAWEGCQGAAAALVIRGTTVPLSTAKSIFPQWLGTSNANNSFLKTQQGVYNRRTNWHINSALMANPRPCPTQPGGIPPKMRATGSPFAQPSPPPPFLSTDSWWLGGSGPCAPPPPPHHHHYTPDYMLVCIPEIFFCVSCVSQRRMLCIWCVSQKFFLCIRSRGSHMESHSPCRTSVMGC